eukprot:CAMPEP_0181184392 /NCGR_PEP_ID=MMETSP1096-20121128/8942_1 /TAXON_ID=156174 ORGANISM="Chrysochromulina ericina, Strain CCMP281" /NCGR_SAMPLE_ID=MMETSP1096 /ASSEMBLY_ACC=CAM_ASM_000453 /LENGTH=91 /DNA_ID=CAMNT_0023273151 /DNA_START=205 /DNA_END=480 /DNA_ORIENTATION=+
MQPVGQPPRANKLKYEEPQKATRFSTSRVYRSPPPPTTQPRNHPASIQACPHPDTSNPPNGNHGRATLRASGGYERGLRVALHRNPLWQQE